MFNVGDIVKYAPKWRSPGEEKYIHRVLETNCGAYLIQTLNTSLTLGCTERVTEEMLVRAKKYEVIVIMTRSLEQWHIVTDTEKQTFFGGYDSAGCAIWETNTKGARLMGEDEAYRIVSDLERSE